VPHEIRTHGDVVAFLRPINVAFGHAVREDAVERFGSLIEPARMHSAFEDGAVVGSAGAFTYELTVPGGRVPAAGVTVVGVLPTHRRRGVLTALMREQLDDARARREPVAILWATEERIYGRFGYGIASLGLETRIDTRGAAFQNDAPVESRGRLLDEEEAWSVIPAIYDRVRAETPGMVSRSEDWWRKRRLYDRPDAPGVLFRVALELDGAPEAYALYRLAMDFTSGPNATLDVLEAMGTSLAATREIWRFVLNVDLVRTVKAGRLPVDHPLVLLLDEPRRLDMRLADALWARIVDVELALGARTYASDARVVLDLRDSFCPWNEGRWSLAGGSVARTGDEPDLRCAVNALASVYLGGFTWSELVRSGHVEEARPGAAWHADAVFRADRKPWCPEIF
jgi:predicted acetyltransferase